VTVCQKDSIRRDAVSPGRLDAFQRRREVTSLYDRCNCVRSAEAKVCPLWHASLTMEDGWYHDEYLVHMRAEMLRAYLAWKAAATCEIADDGLSHQQTLLMDDARRAIDTYMEHRTRCQARRQAR
jgi:hypothetical protein